MPFIRQASVYVGPLPEFAGGGALGDAIRLDGDGSRESFAISFSVKKTLLSNPNTSTITITNLGRPVRDALQQRGLAVRLLGGYRDTGVRTLASGSLLSALPVRNGTDIDTTFTMLDGYGGMSRGVYQRTFDGRIPIRDVVADAATRLPGVTVGNIDVDGFTGSRGRVFNGKTTDVLNALAEQYGFSWSVQNGVFQALQDNRASTRVFRISAEEGNLIDAQPQLSGPFQERTGITIVAYLNPILRPGDTVDLRSTVNPQLNGRYKVHTLSFDGTTTSGDWTMSIESLRQF